ncbi:glycosyltransferase family 2 protein [Zooshikella ganghwensis]|uniref:glycosyltransferase family 2 protein n=1 Tax=Zooshikella ganghwensis TaxID=202772 RepID=UPI0004048D77|nr:glycosyltransferase family 2 protein [Zooshikella ganghwensis]
MLNPDEQKYTILMPAKNEALNLSILLPKLKGVLGGDSFEILVINDGSTDNTSEICLKNNVKEIKKKYSSGNGAAVKSGLRKVLTKNVIIMDADGQHRPEDIPKLIDKFEQGFDMIVGSRSRLHQANIFRMIANTVYNKFSSWVVGHHVEDLTSGFRVVETEKISEFIDLYPNGFSYPTTCTIAFFRSGYSVGYERIYVGKREGKSHINIIRDGVRFLLIIFKICMLYSPLKIFFPVSLIYFNIGVLYYIFTYILYGSFTNMGAVLISNSFLVFLVGLVSEQITMLLYRNTKK